jgi:hypothetical protein
MASLMNAIVHKKIDEAYLYGTLISIFGIASVFLRHHSLYILLYILNKVITPSNSPVKRG